MQVKLGRAAILQFALIDSDGFTRLPGADLSGFAVEVWIDNGAGVRVQADPDDVDLPAWQRVEAAVSDLGGGEYAATLTPLVARTHYIIVRHAATSSDWSETLLVSISDLTDVALLIGAGVTVLPE